MHPGMQDKKAYIIKFVLTPYRKSGRYIVRYIRFKPNEGKFDSYIKSRIKLLKSKKIIKHELMHGCENMF